MKKKNWGKNSENSLQTKQIGRDFSLSLILSLKAPSREEYNQVLSGADYLTNRLQVLYINKCNF